jgi:hypothetical protein
MKSHSRQASIRQPFADFAAGADDFRQANPVIEQLGDLSGTREVAKPEATVSLIQ